MWQFDGCRPQPLLTWQLTPLPRNPHEYPHIPYISRSSNHCPIFCRWPFVSIIQFFSGGLRKNCLISARVTFRPFKVFDFGANRKGVSDFLFVHHSNLGHILHCFGDIAGFLCSWPHPYSTQILGCSCCTRSPTLGSARAEALTHLCLASPKMGHLFDSRYKNNSGTNGLSYSAVKLFLKYSNLCENHTSTSQTDRQLLWHNRALHSIAR